MTTRSSHVRVLPLNESHLPAILEIEAASKAIIQRAGIEGLTARALGDIVGLTKLHNVRVAEADDQAIGWLAWRDESPGVAYLEELQVHPDQHRAGVAEALLREMRAEAKKLGLQELVTRAWPNVVSAKAFLDKSGFVPLDDKSPPSVMQWRDEQAGLGKAVRVGEAILWAPVQP